MTPMPDNDHTLPDGTIWHSGPAAPVEPAPTPQASGQTLLLGDILAIRGMTRVDPPLDEACVVVTFKVHDRLGDDPGDYTHMVLGDRVLAVEPPAAEDVPVGQHWERAEVVEAVTEQVGDRGGDKVEEPAASDKPAKGGAA